MLGQIVKHTFIQVIGRLGGLVIRLFTIALLTRYLGQTGFGWYVVAFSWLQIFAILVDLGLYMVGLKMIGQNRERKQEIFSQLFWLRLFSAIVFVLLLPQLIWFFPYELPIKLAVAILAYAFFLATLNQLLTVSFQERLKMQYVAAGEIAGKVAALLALALVVKLDWGFYWAMVTVGIYGLVQFLFIYLRLGKAYKIKWFWQKDLLQQILSEAWPLGLIIIFNTIYFRADTVILSWFRAAAEVGLYGAAYKVLEIIVSFPAMYLGLLLPYLADWWSSQQLEKIKDYLQKSFDLSLLLALPLIGIGWLIAEPLMGLVAGVDFIASGLWLKILLPAAGFIFFGQLFGYVLIGIGRQRTLLKSFSWVAVITLGLYFVFIPIYGTWAAAWLTVLAEGAAAVVLGWQVGQKLNWRPRLNKFFKLILIVLIMLSVMWAINDLLPWWLTAIAGGLVYLYCLGLFGIFSFIEVKKMLTEK